LTAGTPSASPARTRRSFTAKWGQADGRHRSFEVFPFSYPEYLAFRPLGAGPGILRRYLDEGGSRATCASATADPAAAPARHRGTRHRAAPSAEGGKARHELGPLPPRQHGQPLPSRASQRPWRPNVSQTSPASGFLRTPIFSLPSEVQRLIQEAVVAPKKYYAVDNGLRLANSPNMTRRGHRLEKRCLPLAPAAWPAALLCWRKGLLGVRFRHRRLGDSGLRKTDAGEHRPGVGGAAPGLRAPGRARRPGDS